MLLCVYPLIQTSKCGTTACFASLAHPNRGREREDGFAEQEDKAGAAAVRGPVEETTGWRRMFIFREMRRMNAALMLYGSENVANAIFKLSLN